MKTQMFGIPGILLFLCPIFFWVIPCLCKGALILILNIYRMLLVPEGVISLGLYALIPGIYFIMIAGTYFTYEYIWPEKKTGSG